jgi:ABC-type nitrate/sulfonate/bicarbonate transport system substrate-binding protein
MDKTKRSITTLATPHLHRRAFLQRSAAASGIFMLPAGFGTAAMAQDMTKMVHQLGWVKSIQFGGHFAAIENGYFAEEGIDAEFLPGGPGGIGTDVAVASGQAMTSDTDVEGTIRARIGGLPVRAFGAIMQKAPGAIMSLAENPLVTLGDFSGKTIALPDGMRPQLTALMTTAGVDPASVTFVPVGTDPGILAAGQVDGYYGWATNQGVMLQTRGVDIAVAYMNDLGVPGYAGVLIATDEMIDTQPDLLTAWLRAEIKGWQWHLDNPEEMALLMVEKYGQRGLDLTAQTLESKMMADFVPVGDAAANGLLWIEPVTFEQGIAFVVSAGELAEGAMTANDAMTQDLIRAAHAG